ncbi:prenyltransferase/squalene oxidase repeat-containing protein [Nocardioides dongkuii]|uniref:prenyltransferase/squalene oxidase repeat-containing protein n=1 Tax=Nocardioides dongkuii TaxID=2760089 RepID=UPI0015F89509|nr:prenyltransferase/squalene oxidase repeat-containing protein [Nocardioides dongkuii]
MFTILRRAAGLLAVPALVLPAVAGTAAPATAAEPDPGPAQAGVAWLTDQMTDGLLDGACPFYCGRNIDAALGLDAAGADPAILDRMREGFAPEVRGYISYSYVVDGNPQTGDVGGSTAKTAVFAQLVGVAAGAEYGGVDLVDRLAGLVDDRNGRLFDTANGQRDDQFANTLGQAFAARALHDAGHAEADAATEWLIAQQCDAGFFREGFSTPNAPAQGCDGAGSPTPSVDATALALQMLANQSDDPSVDAALDAGAGWLARVQHADGSWGSQPGSPGNANSTGMAGQALGMLGDRAAAEDAAAWVRGVQADDPAPCTTGLTGQAGAVGFDRSAVAAARTGGITAGTVTQWQYATAQAIGVLPYAPTTGAGTTVAVTDAGYRKAGTSVRVAAAGLAPGDTVCATRSGKAAGFFTAGRNGRALGSVVLPQGTATRSYVLHDGEGRVASYAFSVLGAKKLPLKLTRAKVAQRAKQKVRVTGLAPRESVRLELRGKRVAVGKATRAGVFQKRFRVGTKPGRAKVTVVGEFGNRTGTATFRVVR